MTKQEYNRLRSRLRFQREPEKVRAQIRRYYEAHREEIAARRKAKRLQKKLEQA